MNRGDLERPRVKHNVGVTERSLAHPPLHRPLPAEGNQQGDVGVWAEPLMGILLSLLAGLFALWLSLTIRGSMGLSKIARELLPLLSSRIATAAILGIMVCVIGLPLILPWFAAFLAAYIFIPRKSVLWTSWACAASGALAGILAFWIDAVVFCLFTSGSLYSLNVPLLKFASIPAAVLGGAICLTAAVGRRLFTGGSYPAGSRP